MWNVTSNGYIKSASISASNVKQNAHKNSNSVKHQRCDTLRCVLLRSSRARKCTNITKRRENSGFCGENIVFYKPSGRRMRGIAKILLRAVHTFSLRRCVVFVAHHFAFTFLNFEKYELLWSFSVLKIRVSLVRFQSRPPIRTAVLHCRTAVFLFLGRRQCRWPNCP